MSRLYLLAHLLTGDAGMAEDCFVRGLEDSLRSNRVFRDWAESWARRMVVQNAIQIVNPRVADSRRRERQDASNAPATIPAVTALPTFERFVFVLTVLERYSLQESALLLGCGREDVSAARVRALEQIGQSADHSQDKQSGRRNEPAVLRFAVSA